MPWLTGFSRRKCIWFFFAIRKKHMSMVVMVIFIPRWKSAFLWVSYAEPTAHDSRKKVWFCYCAAVWGVRNVFPASQNKVTIPTAHVRYSTCWPPWRPYFWNERLPIARCAERSFVWTRRLSDSHSINRPKHMIYIIFGINIRSKTESKHNVYEYNS